MYAETQPHAAYTAFTHGLESKWSYLLRVTNWNKLSPTNLLQPLESVIQNRFIPAISGQATPGKLTRDLLALPVRLGGLGPLIAAEEQHKNTIQFCTPLVERIVNQDHHIGSYLDDQREIIYQKSVHRNVCSKKKEPAQNIHDQLSPNLQHLVELSQENGASTWLTSLLIDDHGFALHKCGFRDAL